MISQLPEGWSDAFINAQMFGTAAEFQGGYKSEQGAGKFKVSHTALDDFEDLQDLMIQEGQKKWNKAKFTLYPTGKFNMDFEWDQEQADEIARLS